MSKDGQKLSGERLFTGMNMNKAHNPIYNGDVWTDRQRKVSSFWAGEKTTHPGAVLEITPIKGTSRFVVDAQGHYWRDVPREQEGILLPQADGYAETTTNEIVDFAKSKGYDITQINNVIEGSGELVDDVVIHEGIPRKSLLGNNGNFDISNSNIYKGLIPFTIGLSFYGSTKK